MMSGEQFIITEQDFKKLSVAKGGAFIQSCNSYVNVSSISAMYPESQADDIQNRKEQPIGVLHTGERAKRYFGQWVLADSQIPDDNGDYRPVKIDPTYYPEVARDCVMTISEYKKVKHLPANEILKIVIGEKPEPRENKGFQKLNNKK